jgi:predicted DNA binding CopG/RHH family protein
LSFAEKTTERRIALRLLFATNVAHMSDGTHLTTWVTKETKDRFAAVARHQGLSDSALLKRLVELMLQGASAAEVPTLAAADRTSRDSRLTVRIRPDDQLLLRERAAARGMAAATYVSVAGPLAGSCTATEGGVADPRENRERAQPAGQKYESDRSGCEPGRAGNRPRAEPLPVLP